MYFIGIFDSFILKNLVFFLFIEFMGYRGENRDVLFCIIEFDVVLWFKIKYGIVG